jgi:Toxin SymE, type I toxin-antitoxin system
MPREATVTSCFDMRVSVPMIRLRGRWLMRAGFREGDALRIEVEEGRLVLMRPGDPIPTRILLPEEH